LSNQEYNEVLTNTDRFISTIEHKLSRLVKTEINAIRQEFKRLDQSQTIDKVIKNFEVLKNSIDSIKGVYCINNLLVYPMKKIK